MRRRAFMALLGSAAAAPLVRPRAAYGQQPAMPVIGLLSTVAPEPFVAELRAVRQGLADTGFVEGRNVAIEYRWAENRPERLPALASELIRHPVAVVVTVGGSASALAAKAAAATTPVVFTIGSDPVALGLVNSLSRPGRNVTGVTFITVTLAAKRLELVHELLPKASVIGVLINPASPGGAEQSKDLQSAARVLGLELHIVGATGEADLDRAFGSLLDRRVGALLVAAEAIFTNLRDQIIALAARHKIPAIYPRHEYVVAGGLMSYATRVEESYRQAGIYAGRILKGEKPADLPVLQPTRFELTVNLKTAKTLGLSVPESFLLRADEVIE